MTAFQEYYENLEARQRRLKAGIPTIIPVTFPRLSKHVPGFIPGESTVIVTGGTGSGKSRFVRKMLIQDVIYFCKKYDLKTTVFLNSLEERKSKVISTLVATYLADTYDIEKSYYDLNNFGIKPMPDDLLFLIKESEEYINEFEKHVQIVHFPNPTGMFKHVMDYLQDNGVFLKKGKTINVKEVNYYSTEWDTYIPNDPTHIIIAITDTLNKYQAEKSNTHYQTLRTFSEFYSHNLLGLRCGVLNCMVQQQKGGKEALETNFKGATIIEKMKPSLDALADCSGTQQDATEIFGVFNPVKWDDYTYGGYPDLRNLDGKFRTISVLKCREGELEMNNEIPMFCKLGYDHFEEMPFPSEKELLKKYYKQ